MTVNDPLVSFFGPATPALGEAAGLSPTDSGRVLREGLPLLVQALTDTDRTPEGRAAIDQAYAAIPNFPSVDAALGAPGGASELMQAGEVLSANVLREPLPSLAVRLGSADPSGTTRLLQLALPLLLSLLAGRGLRPGDLVGAAPASGMGATPAAAGLTAAGLVETLRGRLSGPSGEALGRAAGFTPSTAGRAAAASLPVLLAAIARKGQDEAGAADLLNRSRDLEGLAAGPLPTDPAEVARLEGQGRPLLTHLFGSPDAVTGRLGSAVGGSGASAAKLLALLAPVVLGLLGREAQGSGAGAAGLSRALGELPGLLPGLIPPGMSGLSALLNPPTVAAATPQVRSAPAPRPTPPPTTTTTSTTVTQTRRRGGFPWWLIPLLLLFGLGGCWLTQQNDREPTTASAPATTQEDGESILVTNPTSDADLPAEAFVMSGTAAPGVALTISDEGDEVATATVDDAGNWEAQIPAPTPGEHTYTVEGSDGTQSQFKINIVDEVAATPGDGESIVVTNPTAGATLPAEPFEMSGTATPGITLTVSDQGQEVATATVDDAGNWQAQLPAPTPGEHVYIVEGSDGTQSQFRVTAVEDAGTATGTAAASDGSASTSRPASEDGTETSAPATEPSDSSAPSAGTSSGGTTSPSRPATGTAAAQPSATPPADTATNEAAETTAPEPTTPAAAFAIAEPAADAELPAGGFTLSGTGDPGQTVQILEDGTSLGTVTVADDGTWSLDVPSPAQGAHTYAAQDEAGTELASVAVTVAAADPNASAATCDEPYSLSISDGQTVSEPFRFGGVGEGEGYLVTVRRGERVVGTKRVLLDSTCGWSYQSRPGPGEVTYDVRPLEDPNAEPISTVNLTVAD